MTQATIDTTQIATREDGTTELAPLAAKAREYIAQSKARNTLRAYRADWSDFVTWCETVGREALPATPETLALYLTARAQTCRVSTLSRRIATISQAHKTAGHAPPHKTAVVRTVWAGIRRAKGIAQVGKAPAVTADIRRMVSTLEDTPRRRLHLAMGGRHPGPRADPDRVRRRPPAQ